jgi:hypothetical protein
MWLLFGSDSSIKRLPGGSKFKTVCRQCGQTATFYECEAKESFSVWGVDLLSDTEQVVQCGECLAAFKTDEVPRPIDAKAATKEQARIGKEKAQIERELLHDKRHRDSEVEKKLAELKRKAGK